MTKTNVQPTPSNSQHHDTPNSKNARHQVPCDSGGKNASLELTCKLLNLSLSTFIRRAIHNVKIHTLPYANTSSETKLKPVAMISSFPLHCQFFSKIAEYSFHKSLFQIFLRVTIQNQICIRQWVIVDEVVQFCPLRYGHIQRILDSGAI